MASDETSLRERVAQMLARRASGVKFAPDLPGAITFDDYWNKVLTLRTCGEYREQADEIIALVRSEDAGCPGADAPGGVHRGRERRG